MRELNSQRIAYVKVISGMALLGSMGVFVRHINLPSAEIALVRAFIATIFLFLAMLAGKQRIDWQLLRRNLLPLLISGSALALNMVFIYQAYRFTSISNATLTYYCGPLLALLLSPLVLKEKLSRPKLVGVVIAFAGLYLLNMGNISSGTGGSAAGLLFSLLAALMYTTILLSNKFTTGLSGLLNTAMLMLIAFCVLLPYVLVTHQGPWQLPSVADGLVYLLILGVVHGGLACYLYYSAFQQLPAQSMALCGYVDPLSALFCSAIVLGERMSSGQWLGALLIFGGVAVGELWRGNQKKSVPDTVTQES